MLCTCAAAKTVDVVAVVGLVITVAVAIAAIAAPAPIPLARAAPWKVGLSLPFQTLFRRGLATARGLGLDLGVVKALTISA